MNWKITLNLTNAGGKKFERIIAFFHLESDAQIFLEGIKTKKEHNTGKEITQITHNSITIKEWDKSYDRSFNRVWHSTYTITSHVNTD